MQTSELNNQIKARQKHASSVNVVTFSKTEEIVSLLFEIFASMRMSVVVVIVLVEVVGQKAERKLVVTQKVLLFWLWYRGMPLPK